MQHLFVINPKSFRGVHRLEDIILAIENCFTVKRREVYRIYLSRKPRDAVTAVRRHILALPPDITTRVYAVGGDGILFDCLNAIVGLPNAQLASVPYGSANDFIRAFGENHLDDFRDINEQIAAGTILTDTIESGTNTAINSVLVGIEGLTMLNMWKRHINDGIITRIGLYKNHIAVRTVLCAVLALFDSDTRNQYYRMTVDGEDLSGCYATINMSNGPCYGGNMTGAAEASPRDGLIDVIAVRKASLITMVLKDLPLYSTGHFRKFKAEKYVFRRAKHIHIESATPLKISADGEPYIANEINVTIKEKAVSFVNVKGYSYKNPPSCEEGGH